MPIEPLSIFLRQVRNRSNEHQQAMRLLASAQLAGQMISVLRQELDSMVRVIYLLEQDPVRRAQLVEDSVTGQRWVRAGARAPVTDDEMVKLADSLQGWTRSVYKFGCAFIHLSALHDYNDRDPLMLLPEQERQDILDHCRHYHGGPLSEGATFSDLVPYLPRVMDKIANNLKQYLSDIESARDQPRGEE